MVAFIGLGAMGKPMAARLIAAGYTVKVWNRTRGAEKSLTKSGASGAPTPGVCALGADFVVTMLSDAEALANVLEGPDGVLATFEHEKRRPRPVLVDMSTIGRRAAMAVGARIESHGGTFVDAPVSGSVGPAERGELLAMVGGQVRAVERTRPLLNVLCKRVIHAGPIGAGQTLKVVLNGVGAHHLVAFTSMLALAQRAGLARDIVLDAFTSGAFATPSYVSKRDKVLARDYTPEFTLSLTLKDCLLASELANETRLDLPVQKAIVGEVAQGVEEGLGPLDLFALEKHYAR